MISIIINKVKLLFRDKVNIFFTVFFPLIMIFVLGTFLEDVEKTEDAVGDLKVNWYISTEDVALKGSLNQFIDSMDKEDVMTSESVSNLDSALDQLKKKKLSAVVSVTGNPAEYKIYTGNDNVKNRTVKSVLTGFIENYNATKSVATVSPELLTSQVSTSDGKVIDKKFGNSRSMIDYYSVTILVMTIFMVSILTGIDCYRSEKENNTIKRLFLSPKKPTHVFFAGVIGQLPQAILQTLTIMLVSVFVFGAHYAATFTDNIILALCILVIAFTFNTIGVLLGLCCKRNPTIIAMPLTWIMLFLSGSFALEIKIDGVTEYLPPYIVQNSIFELTTCGRMKPILIVTAVCAVLLVVMITSGSFLYTKKSMKEN